MNKLWFVNDGTNVLACFETKVEAEEYREQFSEEDDFYYYEVYGILVEDIEDYPDEFELAENEGLV